MPPLFAQSPGPSDLSSILAALSAIEIPEAPAARAFPGFPGGTSIPAPRGGPDAALLSQIMLLLQGRQTPPIPSLGQLIGG